mmetsp:Transcript_18402/g.59850  ORF Transcript_18402/g.59850 Transcript_18402/m.59850 type:complete len:279 (-) Transcript_18402:169-1005(-)
MRGCGRGCLAGERARGGRPRQAQRRRRRQRLRGRAEPRSARLRHNVTRVVQARAFGHAPERPRRPLRHPHRRLGVGLRRRGPLAPRARGRARARSPSNGVADAGGGGSGSCAALWAHRLRSRRAFPLRLRRGRQRRSVRGRPCPRHRNASLGRASVRGSHGRRSLGPRGRSARWSVVHRRRGQRGRGRRGDSRAPPLRSGPRRAAVARAARAARAHDGARGALARRACAQAHARELWRLRRCVPRAAQGAGSLRQRRRGRRGCRFRCARARARARGGE